MRLSELWMEGLSAFREAQTIDFRALDDLFAIVGPTGAGKTTILDGISLALFGEVPRANQHQRKDFITLGAPEAKVRLDFTAGGVEYRVARRLPRNRSQVITLEQRQADTWVPDPEVLDGSVADVNRRIEQILGYDYDAFTKAVLLPQGDFAQFLRGRVDERRNLLSRLLDSEKYEKAGQIARGRAQDAEREIQIRTEVLERDWSDATEERRAAFADEATLLRAKETTLRGLLSRVESSVARVGELRSKAAALHARDVRVSEAGRALDALRADSTTLEDEAQATADAVTRAEAALAEAKQTLHGAETALTAALEESGDEVLLARLQTAAETAQQAERDLAALAERHAAAEQALTAEQQGLNAAKEAQTIAAQAEHTAFARHEEARGCVADVRDAVRLAREREESERALVSARDAVAAMTPRVGAAREQHKAAKSALREAERAHAELQTAHSAEALRATLSEGAPCPVCEQVVASLPGPGPGHEALGAAARAVTEARRTLESAVEEEREADRAATRAQTELEQGEQRLAQMSAAEPVAADALASAEAAERTAKNALDAAAEARKAADGDVAAKTGAHATAEATLAGVVEQQRTLERRGRTARATIEERFAGQPAAAVAERVTVMQQRLRTHREEETKVRKAVAERTTALAHATRDRSAHETRTRSIVTRLVALRTQLAAEIGAEVPAVAGGVTDEDGAEHDASAVREITRLATFCGERADDLNARAVAAEGEADDLERRTMAQIEETELDVPEAEGDVTVRALTALRRWIQVTGEAAARAEAEAASVARRIVLRAEHEAQIAKLTTTAGRYRKVGQELRSDRFIKFVLEESFQELALRASEELRRVSNNRYSLKASGYDFEVIDHANADECRSVVTLSGGESFLASLSLSLAFAGSIRDLAGDALGARLESVFIDEGFGSLDPDVLDVVADGLERVQEDRRQVCIITHVPSLAARIPSGLRVEPGPGGSNVLPRG